MLLMATLIERLNLFHFTLFTISALFSQLFKIFTFALTIFIINKSEIVDIIMLFLSTATHIFLRDK